MTMQRCAVFLLAVIVSAVWLTEGASAAKLSSSEKIEIKIDPKAVSDDSKLLWDRFGNFCQIAEWHPVVRSCTEGKEDGVVYRTLSLEDGGKIKEKLLSLSPSGYRYAIVESPLPVKNYEASFSVNSTNDELDIVWSASYDAADGKTDSDARAAIDGVFKSGVASIKSKLPDALKDRVREKADGALKN